MTDITDRFERTLEKTLCGTVKKKKKGKRQDEGPKGGGSAGMRTKS